MMKKRQIQAQKRAKRVRAKVRGTQIKPRLSVFCSNKFIYAQIIDDEKGKTLISCGPKEITDLKGTKKEKAEVTGQALAKKALKVKIREVVFDRGPRLYHGRVKALAEGARKGGLKF